MHCIRAVSSRGEVALFCAEFALWGIGFAFVDPSKIRGWLRAA